MFKRLFILVLLVGCGNFVRPKHNPGTGAETQVLDLVVFADIKNQILVPHCVRCHFNYNQYTVVRSEAGAIFNAVVENRMPKNSAPLNEGLKSLLRAWIDGGLQDVAMTDPPSPIIENPETLPTWESLSKNIFGPKCVLCHNPTGDAPWIDVSTRSGMTKTLLKYIDFKNVDNSKLIKRLQDTEEPMPPLPPISNIPQLTAEEVRVVRQWIDDGIP